MMGDKKNILFVDDEQNVLDGLRRMLRPMRTEWNMAFASGGEEALDILSQKRFDVIITDMRMPGMSGEQLLIEVRRRFPRVVRLVLSGQADKDSILESVGPIHQFLQKPCEAGMLTATISRTIELDTIFADERLKEVVSGMESLPSLPSNQQEILALVQMENVTAKAIGDAISKDMAMSAKILQLVNSAFFGLRRHVGTPAEAVMLLGVSTVRSLVLTMQVFSQVAQEETHGFSQEQLLSHSVAVATMAQAIATSMDRTTAEVEEAYMGGLLHDVGKLVLASEMPEEFAEVRRLAKAEQLSIEAAERQVIGTSHGEIGGYLLGLWAFETAVVDAAVFHHCPARHHSDSFTPLTAVHVANALVNHDPEDAAVTSPDIDEEYLARIGLDDQLPTWQSACQRAA